MSVRRSSLLLAGLIATTTACAGGGSVPAEWQLASPPQGTALELEVALGLPCNELGDIAVLESSGDVLIQVAVEVATEECDAMFVTETTTVELSQPLGERELVGCAPTDEATIRFGSEPADGCRPGG